MTFLAEKIDASGPYGIYIYYKDLLFPSEGWPFPEALYAVNRVKRTILLLVLSLAQKDLFIAGMGLLLLPWKRKIRMIENFIVQFNRSAQIDFDSYYLADNRFCTCCRELRILIQEFLIALGISELAAKFFARNLSMLLEYDNAYRYRFQDVLSETTKEQLLNNPRKELARIMQLFVVRDNPDTAGKFITFIKLLSYGTLHPKVKRALLTAIAAVEVKNLQLSEADRYHCLIRDNYLYFGQPYAVREQEWLRLHGGKAPGQVEYRQKKTDTV